MLYYLVKMKNVRKLRTVNAAERMVSMATSLRMAVLDVENSKALRIVEPRGFTTGRSGEHS